MDPNSLLKIECYGTPLGTWASQLLKTSIMTGMPKCPSSGLRTILKYKLLGEACFRLTLHAAVKVVILVIRNATDLVTAMLVRFH